jgi:hypothetical protein
MKARLEALVHARWFERTIVALCCLPLEAQFAAALRLLRLVTALPKLHLLVGALLKSLGAMRYVGLLLALMFYIYGVAGVHLFRQANPAHFGSLPAALLALFQVTTLDNWSETYRAVRAGAPVAAPVYFISFILLDTMIMLNLFIGIIMNSMSEMHRELAGRHRPEPAAERGPATADDDLRRRVAHRLVRFEAAAAAADPHEQLLSRGRGGASGCRFLRGGRAGLPGRHGGVRRVAGLLCLAGVGRRGGLRRGLAAPLGRVTRRMSGPRPIRRMNGHPW